MDGIETNGYSTPDPVIAEEKLRERILVTLELASSLMKIYRRQHAVGDDKMRESYWLLCQARMGFVSIRPDTGTP